MDQERGKILATLFEPCIQPLLDDSILSSWPFPPFSPPFFISLPPSLPPPPQLLSTLVLLRPHPPHMQTFVFQAQVCPRLCSGPAATLTPAGVGTGSSEGL